MIIFLIFLIIANFFLINFGGQVDCDVNVKGLGKAINATTDPNQEPCTKEEVKIYMEERDYNTARYFFKLLPITFLFSLAPLGLILVINVLVFWILHKRKLV